MRRTTIYIPLACHAEIEIAISLSVKHLSKQSSQSEIQCIDLYKAHLLNHFTVVNLKDIRYFIIPIFRYVQYFSCRLPYTCAIRSRTKLIRHRVSFFTFSYVFFTIIYLRRLLALIFFSAQFIKIISHYKKIGYNINVLQQTACLVVSPITVGNFAFLFNCTPVGRTSDSMMVPT